MANSEITSESSLRNYIDRPSSEQLRACSDVLSDACSSCSGEFGCRSFVKLALSTLFTICHVKKLQLRVFVNHNLAGFH